MLAQPQSVLIVDDNFNVRAALRAFIECTMGMEVCAWAVNGSEAIKKAEEHKPALVLIDLSMPVMNGLEAASAIRKILPETRIVIFTLYSDMLGELLAKAVGVDLIISKSEGAAGLLRALRPFLDVAVPDSFEPVVAGSPQHLQSSCSNLAKIYNAAPPVKS